MGDDRPRERKARGLLSSYYGVGASGADPLDLDGPSFNSDKYVSRLLENQSLADLVHKGNDLVTEIKSLDSDMQMLVYENYNKFISATDTIRSMKEKVEGMEDQMNQLASNMETIIESNRSISSNVSGRRGQLEKLNGVRKLLVKLQFLFELPTKLQKCIEAGEHEKAVTYYAAATSILKHYGHLASFQSIHDEAVDIMTRLKAKLVEMLAGVQPSLAKLGLTVKLLLQLQGSEEDLLQRFVAHARTLCAAELAKLPVFAEAAGEGPAERMTTWSANASAVYQSAALETLELFASLFPRTRVGGAPSSSTDKSAGAQPSNAAIQRRLGLLQQCMDEVFGAYAKQITTAAHAGAAIEPLTIAIRALVEPTRAVAAESQGLHLSQEALAKRASAMGAELARGGIAAELKAFGTAASAAMAKLCAKGAAPAGGGSASLASTGLVKNDTVRELVHETCSAVLGAIDTAIQHVRPLLLALPAQGLVQDLVEQLMASILAFVASVRDASLAHAPHGEARAEGEVAGLFLACTTCVQLAQRMRTELQQMVSGHLMFARAEYSAPLPIQQVVLQLEEASDVLNVQCVDLLARELGEELRVAMVTTDWLSLPKPRAVSPYVERLVLYAARVLGTFGSLFNDGVAAGVRPPWLPAAAMPAPKQYQSRLKQAQLSASVVIQTDIDRMFARKISILAEPAQSSKAAVGRLIKLALKTLCELVRCSTLSRHGYQQLQVDTTMLRWVLHDCVDDTTVLQALIDEVMTSAHERCLKPDPIENELIEALCDAKRQQLTTQAADARPPAPQK